jgi:hypothetical protein
VLGMGYAVEIPGANPRPSRKEVSDLQLLPIPSRPKWAGRAASRGFCLHGIVS